MRVMRLLDRYLLRELLVPLGYCLGGFLVFWIAFDLFAELPDHRNKGLSASEIAEYYVVITPEFVVQVLPVALLLALLYTLTDLARHHETTAIRAAGVSLWRLAAPYLAIGLAACLLSFALNEMWVPDSSDRADAVLRRHLPVKAGAYSRTKVRHLGFTNARDKRIWQIGLYNAETAEMTDPKVFWSQTDGTPMVLHASRGIYTNNTWLFFNVAIYRESASTNSLPEPLLQTNLWLMPLFSETPELIKSEVKVGNSMVLRRSKRSTDLSIRELLNYLRLHPEPAPADAAWLHTRLHGRLAAPWTCLVVVLIALPFAAASGRRNVFVGVASSILFVFAYFILQQFGLALGSGGYLLPWVAAWLPNVSFGLMGVLMTARVR
jgi:lipopolysaccharide export system permease protein